MVDFNFDCNFDRDFDCNFHRDFVCDVDGARRADGLHMHTRPLPATLRNGCATQRVEGCAGKARGLHARGRPRGMTAL